MTLEEVHEAATQRRDRLEGTSRGRYSRPGQRRSAEFPGSRPAGVVRAKITIRSAGSGSLDFLGQASAYERGYEMYDWAGPYTEIVSCGAGGKCIKRNDLDTPLVLGHDSMRRIARTTNGSLSLSESDAGLDVSAPELDARDSDVSYIAPKIESGLIDEMSFRFGITSGQWSPDYTEYRINEYDIHRGDVSIVGYGANPFTSASLRGQGGARAVRGAVRRDLRGIASRMTSRALSSADTQALTALLMQVSAADAVLDPLCDALCAADGALDLAEVTLSALLGLPAPAPDDMAMECATDPSRDRLRSLLASALAD